MPKHENLLGQKFGMLTVVDEIRVKGNTRYRYFLKCLCDCGNETLVEKAKVKGGWTRSCGCMQKEMRKRLGSSHKLPEGEASFNETYRAYKKAAKIRGYSFELDKESFREIVIQPCIYCGSCRTQTRKKDCWNGEFWYTGIDRFDNTKGYTKENSVPCCGKCNRMKSDMSIEEFKDRIETIMSRKEMWFKQ